MNQKTLTLSCILLLLLAGACAPRRDLVYFSNMASTAKVENDTKNQDVRIRQDDIIDLTMTSMSPESNSLFINNKSVSSSYPLKRDNYEVKVNRNGYVYLPLIGFYKVEGLTIDEAQHGIANALSQHVKSPEIEIQIANFKITVIGEVNKPATFVLTDERVNVLEALGMAGDMTVYGKRDNVLLIRNENGAKTMVRLNLNKKETFDSPYFYLKQNDIVYVEPDRSKAVEYSQNTRMMPIITASITALAVMLAVILKR